ncbi:hypothetical protein NDU88_003858 [Pleurodeles waltl]|uniref:Uncharacterized protein n=1 Tax=Pleurodeles waltl TaxID=8319 RepID=A0AAV7RE45_PLEWA|nr:hypothetical protein NDU88_003858 [Pleurodeles waltl]
MKSTVPVTGTSTQDQERGPGLIRPQTGADRPALGLDFTWAHTQVHLVRVLRGAGSFDVCVSERHTCYCLPQCLLADVVVPRCNECEEKQNAPTLGELGTSKNQVAVFKVKGPSVLNACQESLSKDIV